MKYICIYNNKTKIIYNYCRFLCRNTPWIAHSHERAESWGALKTYISHKQRH